MWICPDPLGHLQATGVDAAGRKQYLYHPRWREHRDRAEVREDGELRGGAAQAAHAGWPGDLEAEELDARARPGLRGAAARRRHVPDRQRAVRRRGGRRRAGHGPQGARHGRATTTVVFDYLAKGGIRRVQAIADPLVARDRPHAQAPRGRRRAAARLPQRPPLVRVRSDDINDYLKEQLGEDFSAKDFRTWNATVLAAVSLAADGRDADYQDAPASARSTAPCARSPSCSATRRPWRGAPTSTRACSTATCRAGRSRPRSTGSATSTVPMTGVRARIERAVLDLLTDDRESPALERIRAVKAA